MAMVGLVITNVFTNISPTGGTGDDDYSSNDEYDLHGYVDLPFALKSM